MMRSLRLLALTLVLVLAGLPAGSGLPDAQAQAQDQGDGLRGLVPPQRVDGVADRRREGLLRGPRRQGGRRRARALLHRPGDGGVQGRRHRVRGGLPLQRARGAREAEAPARRRRPRLPEVGGAAHLLEGDQEREGHRGHRRHLDRLRQAGEGRDRAGLGEADQGRQPAGRSRRRSARGSRRTTRSRTR